MAIRIICSQKQRTKLMEVIAVRNPKRIGEFCDRLKSAWATVPDMRFGQLVAILQSAGGDLFYLEDDEVLKLIEQKIGRDAHG